MRVKAIRRGEFRGQIIEAGEEFDVPDELMTAKQDGNGNVVAPKWFEPVGLPAEDESDFA